MKQRINLSRILLAVCLTSMALGGASLVYGLINDPVRA